LIDLIEVKLNLTNINNKKFEIESKFEVQLLNKNIPRGMSVNIDQEVVKNLLRVKGAVAMKEAMKFADSKKYEEGENLLKMMEEQ